MQTQAVQRIMVAVALLGIGLWMVPMLVPAVEVGDKAPDFLMHSTVGETVQLSDYQGKKNVLLFFFVAAFTGV
jgi:cytochrome oxidase Cu insertion factor (SCO1/SenC/PrrC family)